MALENLLVTQCGWLRLCTKVDMGMNISNFWKMFLYGVKRDHFEKLISIRELSERLAQHCFNNHFPPDSGTPEKNIPPLDEVDDGDTIYNLCAIHFYGCIYPSAAARNICDITQYSASSIYIGYQNIAEKEEAREGGRYNRLTRGYCPGRLTNGKRRLKRSLWFCKECNSFNKQMYYFRQVGRDCFTTHHKSLIRLP